MSDLVGNPEDRFSRVAAQMIPTNGTIEEPRVHVLLVAACVQRIKDLLE